MKNYIVRDVLTGTEIEEFDTQKEAFKAIKNFEAEDKKQKIHEINFYEVYSIAEGRTVPTF